MCQKMNGAPNAGVKRQQDAKGRQCVSDKAGSINAVSGDPCRPTSKVDGSDKGKERQVAYQPMVLPHQLGLLTASKGNAAKPNASCAQQELDDEQGDSDQAKGLRNEMTPSACCTREGRCTQVTACQVVK
jgi:hypothetical protein